MDAEQHTGKHHILELRIHGIKNTPPSEMLGVDKADLRQYQGDADGGFWMATRLPEPDPDDPAPDPVIPPPDVRREAYSWGALARYGGGALVIIGQFFVQLAWLLLLPFGLANSAYWTRRIPNQRSGGEWEGGVGASSLRVFALGLTLLYVCALGSVSLDLIGTQCLGGAACPAMPSGIADFFGTAFMAQRGRQLALLSLVPLAGVVVLYLVSHNARMRYEAGIFDTVRKMRMADKGSGQQKRRPLSVEGFWQQTRVGSPTEWLHLAATFFLVVLLLAWDRVFAGNRGCGQLQSFWASGCAGRLFDPRLGTWYFGLAGVIAIVGLAWVVAWIVLVSDTVNRGKQETLDFLRNAQHRREMIAGVTFAVAVLLFVLVGVALFANGDYVRSGDSPFLGLITAPSIILGALVAICLSAFGWRRGVPHLVSISLMAVAGIAFLIGVSMNASSARGDASPWQWLFYGIAAVCVLAQFVLVAVTPRIQGRPTHFRTEGWAGAGPGVWMLLALGGAMILSTLLVLGVQSWLGSGTPVCGCAAPAGYPLVAPIAYRNFGDVLPLVALVLIVIVGAAVALRMLWVPKLTTPVTEGGPRPLLEPVSNYVNGRVERGLTADRLAQKILRARRFAALFHRGEPILGILAVLLAIGFVVVLAVSGTTFFAWIDGFAGPVLGLVAVGAVVAIAENAVTTKERPIGVMWDLMCFLPRAGHPFGPPCYAERVVPELRDRVVDWLTHDEVPPSVLTPARQQEWKDEAEQRALGEERPFKVILSAHSLGAVLAVACLFTLRPETNDGLRNVGLLTYGTQLRVYFGRFFPELFGPGPLGTPTQFTPSLRRADPWYTQVIADHGDLDEPGPGDEDTDDPTLIQLLTQPDGEVAWFNLWRRTDYLGFPVFSHKPNPIDSGADEFGPPRYLVKVATHPNYQATPQYVANLERMITLLED
jgi:hypothetical protein